MHVKLVEFCIEIVVREIYTVCFYTHLSKVTSIYCNIARTIFKLTFVK